MDSRRPQSFAPSHKDIWDSELPESIKIMLSNIVPSSFGNPEITFHTFSNFSPSPLVYAVNSSVPDTRKEPSSPKEDYLALRICRGTDFELSATSGLEVPQLKALRKVLEGHEFFKCMKALIELKEGWETYCAKYPDIHPYTVGEWTIFLREEE